MKELFDSFTYRVNMKCSLPKQTQELTMDMGRLTLKMNING